MAAIRRRLDLELLRRGLCASRREAISMVEAGRVTVGGAIADKPARLVAGGEPILIIGEAPRFVSRGGEKLDAALEAFDVVVEERRALDAGASTGGFTDCLLQRGAAHVVALDVGHSQLHERIRRHPRVRVIERFNVRAVTPNDIGGRVELIVADLSFISLTVVLPALLHVAEPGADLVMLVKPQFEAGRREVGRGRGVITDPEIHERVQTTIHTALGDLGADVMGWVDSPIHGADGNKEFLVHARAPGEALT